MQLKKWPNEFAQLPVNCQNGFEYQLEHCKTPIALVESFEKKNLKLPLNASQESSSKYLNTNSTKIRY